LHKNPNFNLATIVLCGDARYRFVDKRFISNELYRSTMGKPHAVYGRKCRAAILNHSPQASQCSPMWKCYDAESAWLFNNNKSEESCENFLRLLKKLVYNAAYLKGDQICRRFLVNDYAC
jgi:hypothetical protein